MSPVAISTTPREIPRRPSPWHDLAHSLSTSSIKPPVSSSPSATTSTSTPTSTSQSPSPSPSPSPKLSSSALRTWSYQLSTSAAQRHHLSPRHRSPKVAAERDKEGHIEYKLKLIEPTSERFERLISQLGWRLRQGRGEAIYEIGLADDGTVIGLTRQEMDSSLTTLEQMAAEVGATVLILREIVLLADPKINKFHLPRKISKTQVLLDDKPKEDGKVGYRSRRERGREVWTDEDGYVGNVQRQKQVIFDPEDMEGSTDDDEDGDGVGSMAGRTRTNSTATPISTEDEDIPPFHLDLEQEQEPEDPHILATSIKHRWKRHTRTSTLDRAPQVKVLSMTEEEQRFRLMKDEAKRLKSAKKREDRRLDLLRGDGRSPIPIPLPAPPTSNGNGSAIRSSLRLTNPYPIMEDEAFPLDLLTTPLDNLSLSFASVQTITRPLDDTPPSPCSSSDRLGYGADIDNLNAEVDLGVDGAKGEKIELICVEALVVRKGPHGVGRALSKVEDEDEEEVEDDEEEEGEEEEEWEYGGEEDGWGFGNLGDPLEGLRITGEGGGDDAWGFG